MMSKSVFKNFNVKSIFTIFMVLFCFTAIIAQSVANGQLSEESLVKLDKIRTLFDPLYGLLVVIGGFVVKRFSGSKATSYLGQTSIKVLAVAALVGVAFFFVKGGDIWIYLTSYTFATSFYEIVIKTIIKIYQKSDPLPEPNLGDILDSGQQPDVPK